MSASLHDPKHAYWCAVPWCPQYVRNHDGRAASPSGPTPDHHMCYAHPPAWCRCGVVNCHPRGRGAMSDRYRVFREISEYQRLLDKQRRPSTEPCGHEECDKEPCLYACDDCYRTDGSHDPDIEH